MVVSAREETENSWLSAPLDSLGAGSVEAYDHPAGSFITLTRAGSVPAALPRRRSLRRRAPLFGSEN